MFIRALLVFLALPGVIGVLIPLWIARPWTAFNVLALVPLAVGFGLLLWCVREFFVEGKGTLAPWDPPRQLVSSGLYRVSRNPMYLAVSLMLVGWAIGFSSRGHLWYALLMMAIFHVRVVFFEEPYLARRHRDEWPRYRARVPRWIFPSRRTVLVAWAIVLVSLPIAGLIYEAVADGVAQKEFAPPGTFVDIGGRRLHMICIGDGEPTVFFESSGWGTALSSARARERIASRTTVCSYDRAGNGWSDPGPGPVSAADLARDVAVLQDRAKLRGPFVVVASSIGGLTGEMYARQFPERTAGLILVDAANSRLLPLLESISGRATIALCATSALARFGVVRLVDPFGLGESDENRQAVAVAYNPRPWSTLCGIARGIARSREEFSMAPPLRTDLPLVTLSASTSVDLVPPAFRSVADADEMLKALQASHQEMAKQSTRGIWQLVPDSTHLIGESQPDAVADAVLEMLDAIKGS